MSASAPPTAAATKGGPFPRHHTRPPGGTQLIMLFDGHCRFCTGSAKTLARIIGPGHVKTSSFQDDGVLDSYPGIAHAEAMKRLYVVAPDGRFYGGAAAVARLVRTFRLIGWLAYLYYVPGIKQLADVLYALVAKYRYKLFGKTEQCDGGACHLHG